MRFEKAVAVTTVMIMIGLFVPGIFIIRRGLEEQRSGMDMVGIVRAAVRKVDREEAEGIYGARRSEMPNLFEARNGSRMYYVSDDGRYVIRGEVFDTRTGTNLTDKSLSRARAGEITGATRDFITFKAPNEKTAITVFTDPDCPFCRKLQEQVKGLNDVGITVNYLPFPLSIHPDADRKANAIWCADDRKAAFIAAFEGIDPGSASCESPVGAVKAWGESIGVAGTPTIYAADGSLVAQALASKPEEMLAVLEQRKLRRTAFQ